MFVSFNALTLSPKEERAWVGSLRRPPSTTSSTALLLTRCAYRKRNFVTPVRQSGAPYLMHASFASRAPDGQVVLGGCVLWLHKRLGTQDQDVAVLATSRSRKFYKCSDPGPASEPGRGH
jgi:hypothetical protein